MGQLKVKYNGQWRRAGNVYLISDDTRLGVSVVSSPAGTAPANPTEQTIWVKSSVPVSKWTIQPDEPASPIEGQVWLWDACVGTAAVDITLSNKIRCAIAQCRQYISSVWVSTDCSIYTSGTWKELGLYFYKSGYGLNSADFGSIYLGSWTEGADHSYLESPLNSSDNLHNLTAISGARFSRLIIDVICSSGSEITVMFNKTDSSSAAAWISPLVLNSSGRVSADLSGVTGNLFIYIASNTPTRRTKISNIIFI